MIGTSTPRPRTLRTISGTAAAASSVLTVTRTNWEPAWARRATWMAVASASAVSVFVMDCTTTGWALPTSTPPTSTLTVGRRIGLLLMAARRTERARWSTSVRGSSSWAAERSPGQAPDDVEAGHPDDEREQEHHADDVRQLLGAEADACSEQPFERDHQHPAAIERRERQSVDQRQVGGQDARDVQGQDRAVVPQR